MEEKKQKEGIENDLDLIKYASLYREASNRNWKFVRQYIRKDPNSLLGPISEAFGTLIHVVACTREPEAVRLLKDLVDLVDNKSLEQTDISGMTSLHYAAVYGNAEGVKILLNKNSNLLNILDDLGFAPLFYAAQSGQAESVDILLSRSGLKSGKGPIAEVVDILLPSSGLKSGKGPIAEAVDILRPSSGLKSGKFQIDINVVDQLITTNLFEIALELMNNNSQLPLDGEALQVFFNKLATKALAFRSGSQLGFWQELLYKCIPIERKVSSPHKYKMRDEESHFEDSEKTEHRLGSTFLQNIFTSFGTVKWKVHVVIWKVIKRLVPSAQQIDEEILKHKEAYLLLEHLCEKFKSTAHNFKDAASILKEPILKAATTGIDEIVNEVSKIYPDSLYFTDEENRNILQLAVLRRQEEVFVSIMERLSQTEITLLKDKSGNNVLHYAGKVPSAYVPRAALQMQKEIQWYKVLEDLVHPSLLEAQNNDKKIPWEVFTEEHKELVKQDREWMKNTASSCTVVAGLITTVVFTAACTLPGGNPGDDGTPAFLKHSSLLTFLVADTLALISSTTSILIFLGILTSRYSAIDFMESLPKKLMFGLITLLFSIASMIIAFGAGIHIALFRRFKWVDIPYSLIACFPVILFVRLQFPLLIDIYISTYHSKIYRLKRSQA